MNTEFGTPDLSATKPNTPQPGAPEPGTTELGRYECVVVDFPGNQVSHALAAALKQFIASGAIRLIDLAFIRKGAEGSIESIELSELDPGDAQPFEDLDGEIDNLINADDLKVLATDLPLGSIAAVVVWENVCAARFADAVQSAHGQVWADERIPRTVVEAAMKAAAATTH